jgi:hypothetical protein
MAKCTKAQPAVEDRVALENSAAQHRSRWCVVGERDGASLRLQRPWWSHGSQSLASLRQRLSESKVPRQKSATRSTVRARVEHKFGHQQR